MPPPVKAAPPVITLPVERPRVSTKNNSELIFNTLAVGATAGTAGAPLVDFHCHAKRLSVNLANARNYAEYTELGSQRITDRKPTFTLRIPAHAPPAVANDTSARDVAA